MARATAFAAVMITCNGVVGPPLLMGPLRPRVLGFRTEGAGTASRILNGVFAFVQTVRHRDYFLPLDARGEDEHATSPARRVSLTALGLLIGCLVWRWSGWPRPSRPRSRTASGRSMPRRRWCRDAGLLEVGAKKTFACALDWPGWARSGRDEDRALAALADYAPRYAEVARLAGRRPPGGDLEVVERVPGGGATDFGVPERVCAADAAPLTARDARRLADLVEASWQVLDDAVTASSATLRKGPRGGGRDRDPMLEHVLGAEASYARQLGIRHKPPVLGDDAAVPALRREIAAALRAARSAEHTKWPPRYAARRIAWHVLDHVWKMRDKSDP